MIKSISEDEHACLQWLLRQIRTEAGLRQVDLAQKLGLPQSYVSKYESGKRRLDLVEVHRICLALGISLTQFVQRFEEITSET